MFNSILKPLQSGKEHSLRYDDIDSEFASYLRLNYYNAMLSNYDISEIRKQYLTTN